MDESVILFYNGQVVVTITELERNRDIPMESFVIAFGENRFIGSITDITLYDAPATTK